jgi:hypothetical protein
MKKTKNITKYNLKWQMIRASIKGSDTPLKDKISIVNKYFNEEKTIDAYERVLNYLEGLQMGYRGKNDNAENSIQKEIDDYHSINTAELAKEPNSFITFEDAVKYSFKKRYNLWKDLFIRNKKWLERGYFQKEINDFMDILNQLFEQNEEKLDKAYSFEKLQQLRRKAETKENTHKFFF